LYIGKKNEKIPDSHIFPSELYHAFLFDYFAQPQRSTLIFFWQNENITKQISNESYKKTINYTARKKKYFGQMGSKVEESFTNTFNWIRTSCPCSRSRKERTLQLIKCGNTSNLAWWLNEAQVAKRSHFNISGAISPTRDAMVEEAMVEEAKKSTSLGWPNGAEKSTCARMGTRSK